jgi:adenylate cyclase
MNTRHVILSHIKLLGVTILYWVLALWAFDLFRFVGLEDLPGVALKEELSWMRNAKLFLVLGSFTGLIYFLVEELFDLSWFRKKSIGFRILIKNLCYLIVLTVDVEVGVNIITGIYNHPYLYTPEQLLSSVAVWSFIVYFMFASFLFSFIKIVHEKFGTGVFWKMLIGKYSPPRVERKLFMFLDMKSSTTLAEHMGYSKFSELIQHCFYDLNEVVAVYSGEIYQYVGDEAIIAWDYESGIRNNECIDLYFDFVRKLKENEDFYRKNYGILPEFKAGLHGGELMVAEVGVVKKEIAYHGDVINTTARIQVMCNKLEEHLLISDALMNEMSLKDIYQPNFKGEFVLKGKEGAIPLYGIQPAYR